MSSHPVIPAFDNLSDYEKHHLLLACRVILAMFDDSVDAPGVSETASQFFVSRPTAYAWASELTREWPAIAKKRRAGRPARSRKG